MRSSFVTEHSGLQDRFPFAGLVRPIGGLMESVQSVKQRITEPQFNIRTTSIGNLTMTFPHVSRTTGEDVKHESIGGGGADTDVELAWIRAVVEGAERYACMVYDEADFIIASADELGDVAMDLSTIPRCSEREYADPKCPILKPDPSKPIRWVRGYSLTDMEERWVPAIMTHLYIKPGPGEYFWNQISTGTAAHTSLSSALISAICENIERDAIALTWLAQLSLPRIELERPLPAGLSRNLRQLEKSAIRQYAFDATTDVGIPTVYTLQLVDEHPRLSQFISCATTFDAATALEKTIRESVTSRAVFLYEREVADDVQDFVDLHEGATYMGRTDHRGAFDFLLNSKDRKTLEEISIGPFENEVTRLHFLCHRLNSLGMDAIAVDLTTDELRDVGLWVVRVVTPELMPMSPIYRARYLGHPRLYEYPEQAGYGSRTEADINPFPQPFA